MYAEVGAGEGGGVLWYFVCWWWWDEGITACTVSTILQCGVAITA